MMSKKKFFGSGLKMTNLFSDCSDCLPALSCKIPENDTAYSEMGLKCQEYTRYSEIKVTVPRDFRIQVFFMNQLTKVVHLDFLKPPRIFEKNSK